MHFHVRRERPCLIGEMIPREVICEVWALHQHAPPSPKGVDHMTNNAHQQLNISSWNDCCVYLSNTSMGLWPLGVPGALQRASWSGLNKASERNLELK